MKKFILSIIFVTVAMLGVATAQDPYKASGVYDKDVNFIEGESYVYHNGTLAGGDIIADNDSIYTTYVVYVKSQKPLKPKFFVDLDSIGGIADTVTVGLFSKPFPESTWTRRETSSWITGLDTQITLSSDSAHADEFWKAVIQTDSLNVFIDDYVFKFWEGQ